MLFCPKSFKTEKVCLKRQLSFISLFKITEVVDHYRVVFFKHSTLSTLSLKMSFETLLFTVEKQPDNQKRLNYINLPPFLIS